MKVLYLLPLACLSIPSYAGTGGPHGEPPTPIIPCVNEFSAKLISQAVQYALRPISKEQGEAICDILRRDAGTTQDRAIHDCPDNVGDTANINYCVKHHHCFVKGTYQGYWQRGEANREGSCK